MQPNEPGSKVCSSSVQKVPVWCWRPMSGLFNTVNDHTEDSKSKNEIKSNVVTLGNCALFKIV